MGFRLRRGLDSDRQLITPASGEMMYTIDKREVWVGDGSTPGGNRVTGAIPSSINDLDEFDLEFGNALNSQVLKWQDDQFVLDNAINDGDNYNINISGEDGSILLDSASQTLNITEINGTIITAGSINAEFITGDASGLTNIDQALTNGDFQLNVIGEDSTVIIDSATNTVSGTFVGDGSGLTNVNVSDSIGIFDLNNTYKFSDPDPGDMLIWDGFNFTPDRIRQIIGDDSSVMLDTNTQTFTGNFVGNGSGLTNIDVSNRSVFDLNNVFEAKIPDPGDMLIWDGFNFTPDRIRQIIGDDSTVLLDTNSQTLTARIVTERLEQNFDKIRIFNRNNVETKLSLESVDLPTNLEFRTVSTTDLSSSTTASSIFNFGRDDVNGVLTTAQLYAGGDGYFYVAADKDGLPSSAGESASMVWRDYRLGLGTFVPTATLDVRGEVVVKSYVQFGSFTTTERDAFTAQNGMVIYNSTVDKFQGVENGIWINLSDGTVG